MTVAISLKKITKCEQTVNKRKKESQLTVRVLLVVVFLLINLLRLKYNLGGIPTPCIICMPGEFMIGE